MDVAECRELGEKKAVVFPGQFHEIAAVSEQFESQAPVKGDGASYVPYNDLRHELLCRIHVSAHSWLPPGQRSKPSPYRWALRPHFAAIAAQRFHVQPQAARRTV